MQKVKRVIYTIMPLALLLLCLGLINWLPNQQPSASGSGGQTNGGETAVSTTNNPPAALATLAPPTATPTATPTPAPTPRSTLPPGAAITLLGPPDGSVFSAAAPLSLYWTWPYPLHEDEYFGVYLAAAGTEQLLGRLAEPNLGAGYRWQILPDVFTGLGADLAWQIRLESTLADAPLLSSETRTVRLIGGQ